MRTIGLVIKTDKVKEASKNVENKEVKKTKTANKTKSNSDETPTSN